MKKKVFCVVDPFLCIEATDPSYDVIVLTWVFLMYIFLIIKIFTFSTTAQSKLNDEVTERLINDASKAANLITNSEKGESLPTKNTPPSNNTTNPNSKSNNQVVLELDNEIVEASPTNPAKKSSFDSSNRLGIDKLPKPSISVNCLNVDSNYTQELFSNNIDQKRLSVSLRSISMKRGSHDERRHSSKKNSRESIHCSRSNSPRGSKHENRLKAHRHTFKSIVRRSILVNRVISNFKMSRETAVVKNEQKAVKVLGYVVLAFVVAWAPFAFVNILMGLGLVCCSTYDSILNILTWPGYISSVINPLIYSAFNDKFRYAFKEILKCKCDSLRNDKFRIDALAKAQIVQSVTSNRDRYLFKEKNEYKKFLRRNLNV